MTVRDDLIAAKALIDTPEKWGRGNGHSIGNVPFDRECALTACYRACGSSGPRYDRAVQALQQAIPSSVKKPWMRVLHRYNDASTHADIMALFDRAISTAPQPLPYGGMR